MARLSLPVLLCAGALALSAGAATAATPIASLQADLFSSSAAFGRAASLIRETDESRPTISAASPAAARKRAAALRALAQNRRAFGKAKAQAARILRTAKSPADRTVAAQALGTVATVQEQTIPAILDLIVPATGAAERGLANAELDLTIGRDQAIALNVGLLGAGVSATVAPDLVDQIANLATGRVDEIGKLLDALTNAAVGLPTKSLLARALDAVLSGQALSAVRLGDLSAVGKLPAAAQEVLNNALALVPNELQAAAGLVDGALGLLPPGLRGFVAPIVQNALSSAQTLLSGLAPAAPVTPSMPVLTPPAPGPTTPVPTLGSLLGSIPLPVDPRNILNLLPGLLSPCNLTGFLPSILGINLPGLVSGLLGGCPAATAPTAG
jgi:hypothetical protein